LRRLRRLITLPTVSGSNGKQPVAVFLQQVDVIVEEYGWTPSEKPDIAGLRIELWETGLQRFVKQSGGEKNSTKRVWKIQNDNELGYVE
jgi:hypothetical protein